MSEGPDRSERVVSIRPDLDQQATSHVGMVVFLASWAMMFAALFFSYGLLRLRADSWPPPGAPDLPMGLTGFNTLVMACSSWTLHRACRAASPGPRPVLLRWLAWTVGLGALFLTLQVAAWVSLWRSGLLPSSGVYGSVFYLLTVFHGAHVVVGLGVLGWLWRRCRVIGPGTAGSCRIVAAFWHFVGFVWVLVFVTLYVT